MARKKNETETTAGADPDTRDLADRILVYVASSIVGGSVASTDMKKAWPSYTEVQVNAALNDLHARQLLKFDQKAKVYRVVEKSDAATEETVATEDGPTAREDVDTAKEVIVDYLKLDAQATPTLATICSDLGNCAGLKEAMRELVTEGRVVKHKDGKGKAAVFTYELLAVADQPDEEPAPPYDDSFHPDQLDGGEPLDGVKGNGHAKSDGSNGAPPISGESYHPTRYIEHVLTEDEILSMREEREVHDETIDELQGELDKIKERAKHLQKRIDTESEDALAISRRIRAGSEFRDVECEERKEFDQRVDQPTFGKVVMVVYRLDTNEAIEWRELTKSERQGSLFDPAAPTPPVTEVREHIGQA